MHKWSLHIVLPHCRFYTVKTDVKTPSDLSQKHKEGPEKGFL